MEQSGSVVLPDMWSQYTHLCHLGDDCHIGSPVVFVNTATFVTEAMIIWMLSLILFCAGCIFMVFPALIHTLSGGLSADREQDSDTNPVLTLLLIIALFLVQGVLWGVLRFF